MPRLFAGEARVHYGELAEAFIDWLISVETQARIAEFGVEEFGMPLFTPDSAAWNARPGEE